MSEWKQKIYYVCVCVYIWHIKVEIKKKEDETFQDAYNV